MVFVSDIHICIENSGIGIFQAKENSLIQKFVGKIVLIDFI